MGVIVRSALACASLEGLRREHAIKRGATRNGVRK